MEKKRGDFSRNTYKREERKKKKNTVAKDGLNCMVKHGVLKPLSVYFVKDLEPRRGNRVSFLILPIEDFCFHMRITSLFMVFLCLINRCVFTAVMVCCRNKEI